MEKGIDRLEKDVHNVRNRCPFRASEILVLLVAVISFVKAWSGIISRIGRIIRFELCFVMKRNGWLRRWCCAERAGFYRGFSEIFGILRVGWIKESCLVSLRLDLGMTT